MSHSGEIIDIDDTESNDTMDILGPDTDTGEPRVEIIMDTLLIKTFEASEFLKGIMLRMGLSGRIEATIQDNSVYLNIIGAEPGLIIGHRGQNLDALQHLINRMVNQNSDDVVPVTVDSDDYRNRRSKQLERMVSYICNEAISTNKSIVTDPLTPSERRLFHISASKFSGISTSSFGDGFFQPIKVVYENKNKSTGDYSKQNHSNSHETCSRHISISSCQDLLPNSKPIDPVFDDGD